MEEAEERRLSTDFSEREEEPGKDSWSGRESPRGRPYHCDEGQDLGSVQEGGEPSSEIGRLAQLLKAAGMTASTVVAPPSSPAPGSDAAIAEELDGGS